MNYFDTLRRRIGHALPKHVSDLDAVVSEVVTVLATSMNASPLDVDNVRLETLSGEPCHIKTLNGRHVVSCEKYNELMMKIGFITSVKASSDIGGNEITRYTILTRKAEDFYRHLVQEDRKI